MRTKLNVNYDQSDNLDLSINEADISNPSFERLCALMEKTVRQVFAESRESSDKWLTVDNVAENLKVSRSIVYRWIRTGDLEAVDLGNGNGKIPRRGCYRIQKSSLNEFVEAKKVNSISGRRKKSSVAKGLPKVKDFLEL